MSNKSAGTAFEQEFAKKLAGYGFWVHRMQDNQNGQPFDLIAAKNKRTYVFDCKDCQSGEFRLSRIEENQEQAMKLWSDTGNWEGMFVLQFSGRIYLMPYHMLIALKKSGTKSIAEMDVIRYGKHLEAWVDLQRRIDGEDAGTDQ